MGRKREWWGRDQKKWWGRETEKHWPWHIVQRFIAGPHLLITIMSLWLLISSLYSFTLTTAFLNWMSNSTMLNLAINLHPPCAVYIHSACLVVCLFGCFSSFDFQDENFLSLRNQEFPFPLNCWVIQILSEEDSLRF